MEDTISQLNQLGLTKTEIKLYLSGYNEAQIGVAKLHKLTSIKRPTIYHAMGELSRKGLAIKSEVGGKLAYSFSQPHELKQLVNIQTQLINNKTNIIQNLIKSPLRLTSDSDILPFLRLAGKQGVKDIIDTALNCQSKQWNIISPTKNFLNSFDANYKQYFMNTRFERKIIARSLWEYRDMPRHLTEAEMAHRQPRILPKSIKGMLGSTIILFDNNVAIIESSPNLSGVLIISSETYAAFMAMFEALWSVSEPLI